MIRPIAPLSIALALLAAAAAARGSDRKPVSRLFISPMGEPFRSDLDGDPEAAWFAGTDADHDGRISLVEFKADALRWFAAIDRGHDGEIDPDDIDYYENVLVPEIRVADAARASGAASGAARHGGRRGGGGPGGGGGRAGGGGRMGGGGFGGGQRGGNQAPEGGKDADAGRSMVVRATRQGAARYSYLDYPEPLTAADANLNRGIDKTEMTNAAAERFALLDKNGDGFLEKRELPRVDTRSTGATGRGGRRPGGDHPPPPADRDRQLGGGDRDQD